MMAGLVARLRWWIKVRMSSAEKDIFLILLVLGVFAIIGYVLVLSFDDPDGTVIDTSIAKQRQIIQELQEEHERKPLIDETQKKKENAQKEQSQFAISQEDEYEDEDEEYDDEDEDDEVIQQRAVKQALQDAKRVPLDPDKWIAKYKDELEDVLNPKFKEVKKKKAEDVVELKGGRAQCTVYIAKAYLNDLECVHLQVEVQPQPTVCLYPDEVDMHLSRMIREDGTWEPHMVKLFLDILKTDPELGFIDIGANIGVYSLSAAAAGHSVVAIEPFEENLKHLARGIQLTGVEDKVTMLKNAISHKREDYLNLALDATNQGGIHVDDSNHGYECFGDDCLPQVKAILMDDLLEVTNFKKAVIKIDIEGHEHYAFRESDQLFQQIYISHIIMEWIKMKEFYRTQEEVTKDKLLVYELLRMLKERGYKAYSMVNGREQDPNYWFAWPDDVIWKHELVDVV